MKQIQWMALVALALSGAAQAASFDCAKAQNNVEKFICSDAELSKQDEDMATAYAGALQLDSTAVSVRKAQKQWMKKRNACPDVDCVKNAYATRISLLTTTVPSHQVVVGKQTSASKIVGTSNPKICAAVSDTLRRISKLPKQSYEDPLYVDSIEIGGRTYAYQNVDLDGDGKPDVVEQSCGSPSDGTCTLYVKLSSGGGYEVDEEIFHVMRFDVKYYVLVGHPSAMKNYRRRMYALSEKGAELICKSF